MFPNLDYTGPHIEPSWQEALDQIAPRTEYGHDSLLLRWEPGDPWAPVERLVIWQMTPVWRVPNLGIREALEGPNPRLYGYFDEAEKRFIRKQVLPISFQQWMLYRETGCYGQPLWIVQGRNGGHLRHWTQVQSTISQVNGGLPEPPLPGFLPYAPFDARIVQKLKYLDAVERYGDILRCLADKPYLAGALDRREKAMVAGMGDQLWNWLGSQVEQALEPGKGDGLTRKLAQDIRENVPQVEDEPYDEDREHDDFLAEVADTYS